MRDDGNTDEELDRNQQRLWVSHHALETGSRIAQEESMDDETDEGDDSDEVREGEPYEKFGFTITPIYDKATGERLDGCPFCGCDWGRPDFEYCPVCSDDNGG